MEYRIELNFLLLLLFFCLTCHCLIYLRQYLREQRIIHSKRIIHWWKRTVHITYIKITCSNTNGVQDTSAQYNSANSLNRYLNLLLKLKMPESYRRHIK